MRITTIKPKKDLKDYLKELWEYKSVFFFLGLRDVFVHYRQTTIGILWVLLRSFLNVAIFTLIFGRFAGFPSEGVSYFMIVFSGMLIWQFFADLFIEGSNSLLNHHRMIEKIYFPRIFIPMSRILCSLLDLLVMFVFFLLIGLAKHSGMVFFRIVFFPFVVSWLIFFTLSVAVFFSALIVLYRDFRHTLQFIQQLGFYFSPVGFLSQLVPYPWKYLFFLNPLAGIIEVTRWIFLQLPCNNLCVFISLGSTFLLGWASLSYFFYVENYFADII